MKAEKFFEGEGHFIHWRTVEVRTEDPLAAQPDLRCLSCGEYLEISEPRILEVMYRRLVGVVCPKCGKEQAAGPVSRFSMVDLGEGASKRGAICRRVGEEAAAYWVADLELRIYKFRWIEDHAAVCDPCALVLEEAHRSALKKMRYEKHRGPKDWSPKGEMPSP